MPHPRRPAALTGALVVLVTLLATVLAGGARATAAHAAPTVSAANTAASTAADGPVLLVGTAGVRWDDVSQQVTPTLWGLLERGATGTTAVRSVRSTTCPVDGWLTVSAGRRAADEPPEGAAPGTTEPARCRPLPTPVGTTVPGWSTYVAAARAEKFDATPGRLGQVVKDAGLRATAVGPGAALALATPDGSLAGDYRPEPADAPAALADSDLVVVDVGGVRADDEGGGPREDQLRRVDAALAAATRDVPEGTQTLVVSVADDGPDPHLQLAAATGPGFPAGYLRTSSTRQVALVQLTDVLPTVLSLVGADAPGDSVGSPMTVLTAESGAAPAEVASRLDKLVDLDTAAQEVRQLVSPFFTGLVLAQLVLYGLGAVALRRRWAGDAGRARILRSVRRLALVFATVPVATYLANTVPWWRAGSPLTVVTAVVLGYVAVLSLVAQLGPWRRWPLGPFGAVAAMTALVLAADIVTGSRLQLSSLMGLQPVVAGRFYGFSNVAFALFATGSLLLAVALADGFTRRGRKVAAGALVAAIGVVAVALDVLPRFGSDFGGPLAMVPAFAVLTLLVLGVRLTVLKGLGIAAATVVVITTVSVLDWLRPAADRTHLGRFVQTVIDGGAWQVIQRKGEQNLSILFGSFLSVLVPVGVVFVVLVLARPSSWGATALQRAYDRSPTLRHGLVALVLLLLVGFAVNDSGTAVPAVGATLAIPLVLAASLRALEDDLEAEGGTPAAESAQAR